MKPIKHKSKLMKKIILSSSLIIKKVLKIKFYKKFVIKNVKKNNKNKKEEVTSLTNFKELKLSEKTGNKKVLKISKQIKK